MNIIMLRWLWVEIKYLMSKFKKEIIGYFKSDYLSYLKKLFLGKNKKWMNIFFRIFFFGFIFRLILDISKIIFNFYYIIMFWFFSNLKFFLRFYTFNEFWIDFISKIINFFQYFFLFTPFVKINERLVKRKKKLYVYLLERSIDYSIRMIWWRPRIKVKLAHIAEAVEFILIFFGVIPSKLLVDIITLLTASILEFLYIHYTKWRLYFGIIHYVWQYNKFAGNSYLRQGSSLFHIAHMLQKQGFVVPKARMITRALARFEYKQYKRNYKKAELSPEKLNDEALDIYIFLLDLFSDTRYELKRLPLMEFFFIIFPYEILIHVFWFFFYLYIGLVYLFLFIFFPIVLIFVSFGITYEFIQSLKIFNFLFNHDLEYLAKTKDKIWTKIREDAKKNNEKKWYKRLYIKWAKFKNNWLEL